MIRNPFTTSNFALKHDPIWIPVVALILSSAFAAPRAAAQTCHGPGTERWPIKTSLPAGTDLSNSPKKVAIGALFALENPPGIKNNDPKYQDVRIPKFSNSLNVNEGDILQTTAWLYLVATESDDCDYHIQISNQSRTTTNKPTPDDNCLVVEAPRPDFVDDAALKQALTTVRNYIKTKIVRNNEPSNTGNVMIHQVCVQVTGQLFFDDSHLKKNGDPELRGKRGMSSKTLWELHAISAFQIVPASSCQP